MRVAVLQQNLLGDVIIATPLLRQIRSALPDVHIALALGPLNRDIRPLLGDLIDEVIPYAKSVPSLARIWWHARRPRFDWTIDLAEARLRASQVLVRLIGARRSIGFANGHSGLYDETLPLLPPDRIHIVDRYLTVLPLLGVPPPVDPRLELHLSHDMMTWAEQVWPSERPSVLVNISGTGPAKQWGLDRYAAFMTAAMAAHPALSFVVTGHARESEQIDALAARMSVPRLPATPTFEHFAAVIRRADYVVTPDTSAIHVSAAFQRPCLGLYVHLADGGYWTPYRSPHVKLVSPTPRIEAIPVEAAVAGFDRLVREAAVRLGGREPVAQ